ncbi:hypothetical protein TNCV_2759671 [Trichonephila clavipes]|nr:hypothetical protein TNCV_2759671 [Trichonephila clavipes]
MATPGSLFTHTSQGHEDNLEVTIEEDSSQTCSEVVGQFNTSSVRLHLHRLVFQTLVVTPGHRPAQRKTTYAPTQDYALCLVDLSSSGSVSVATNRPNGHCGPVFPAIGTCIISTASEGANTG